MYKRQTLNREGKSYVSYTKGAPDEVLKRCTSIMKDGKVQPLEGRDRKKIQEAIETMSGRALRVLAGAMAEGVTKPTEKNLVFLGLAGMIDPPRDEAKAAVEAFKRASVRTVMITGDHVDTAFAIARPVSYTHLACLLRR